MKGMIFALVLVVACAIGLGFYMGWFQFSSGSDGNQDSITLSVNKDTIQDDKDKAVDRLQHMGEKDTMAATTPKAQD